MIVTINVYESEVSQITRTFNTDEIPVEKVLNWLGVAFDMGMSKKSTTTNNVTQFPTVTEPEETVFQEPKQPDLKPEQEVTEVSQLPDEPDDFVPSINDITAISKKLVELGLRQNVLQIFKDLANCSGIIGIPADKVGIVWEALADLLKNNTPS